MGALLISLIFCLTSSCDPPPDPDPQPTDQFESAPERFSIVPGIIDEASGLAPSRHFDGYLWTHQDSGRPNAVYLVSADGKSIREYTLPGTRNHDWEDIASGPGPEEDVHYLYVGDIGNNNAPLTATNTIYRVPEIAKPEDAFSPDDVDKITFSYPDGPRDAEALLLDPVTRDIFIISKESSATGIYRLAYPQSTTATITAEKVGTLPSALTVTSGAISTDGSEILIRTYFAAYYWSRKSGESIGAVLMRPASQQPSVALEPQGEAICFAADGKGFYTLSEKSNAPSVTLNFYKRK